MAEAELGEDFNVGSALYDEVEAGDTEIGDTIRHQFADVVGPYEEELDVATPYRHGETAFGSFVPEASLVEQPGCGALHLGFGSHLPTDTTESVSGKVVQHTHTPVSTVLKKRFEPQLPALGVHHHPERVRRDV